MEETFKKFQHKKEEQEAHYLIERTNNLKKEINEYLQTQDASSSVLGFSNQQISPTHILNLKLEEVSSPNKQVDVKDLLRAQMEERKLLEIQQRIQDQDYYKYIQKRDKSAFDAEEKTKQKFKKQQDDYLRALKDQMKEQHKQKLADCEMNEREKQINRMKLKQLIKNNPERHKHRVMQEMAKSRNKENLVKPQPHTFDIVTEKPGLPDSSLKTLDLTKEVKMPGIKLKELNPTDYNFLQEQKALEIDRERNKTPSLPPRNYHYAKIVNNNSDLKLSKKLSKEENLQSGTVATNISYANMNTGK